MAKKRPTRHGLTLLTYPWAAREIKTHFWPPSLDQEPLRQAGPTASSRRQLRLSYMKATPTLTSTYRA
jgi:hypothetical protein